MQYDLIITQQCYIYTHFPPCFVSKGCQMLTIKHIVYDMYININFGL